MSYTKWIRRGLIGLGALMATACATATPQTDAILRDRAGLPEARHIDNVPFVQQSSNYCGPATLAMAMDWAGHPVTLDAIGKEVYTPDKKGSLQADLISASRREGMMAMQIYGMTDLLRELNAGHPVIVLENLAFNWYPMWHYSVALGYDLRDPSIIMHSGHHQDWRLNLRKFERNWKYAQHWGLVVLPPGELAESADELEHCAAASGLEQVGHVKEAEISYRKILTRWPESLGALIGMGNVLYAKGDAEEAARYLSMAVKAHPENAPAWHNLAIAQSGARQWKSARASAERAIAMAPAESREAFRQDLAEILAGRGSASVE